mmetsp:Transcript_49302/g.107316  ORF Transcript_49302/g.107316 Transcript_49302/m.107316 type:complete len:160 (-) Transcript_49302:124-603(-)
MGTFAESLTATVAAKRAEHGKRSYEAAKWCKFEDKLLDRALELFKLRCKREAENQRCDLTVSFEVLTREVEEFPTHTLTDSTYVVDSWGEGLSAESWYYATRGPASSFSPGAPVLFAEVLESMMPKFLDKVKTLGFQSCGREAGTWKVSVSWHQPGARS